MHPILNIATRAVRQASKLLLRSIEGIEAQHLDSDKRSTYAERLAQRCMEEMTTLIHNAHPQHHICGVSEANHSEEAPVSWIIDPLNGSDNYQRGIPHFAISLAIMNDQTLEHAIIYDPIRDELFSASRGKGAQLNNKKIRASTVSKLDQALISTNFPMQQPQHLKTYLNIIESLLPHTQCLRRSGCSALDLAYVAAKRYDGAIDISLNKFNSAAGILLIQEAGGLTSDFHGSNAIFESENIVAGTPKVQKTLLQLIAEKLSL